MANENKKEESLSLKDLGLENEVTPAEMAAKANEEKKENEVVTDNGVSIEVEKVDMSSLPEDDEEEKKPKKNIVRPVADAKNDDGSDHKYNVIKNVRSIAKTKHKKTYEDRVKDNLNNLNALADQEIERTKKELTAPDGRIAKGKELYINDRYASLMKRAEVSTNLANKIKYYENAMDTDPAFDGATEYERKGYILFKVANDTSIGITDKSFGLEQQTIKKTRHSSADVNKNIESIVNGTSEDLVDEDGGNEDTIILGSSKKNKIPVRKSEDVAKEFEMETTEKDISTPIEDPDIDPAETESEPQLPTGLDPDDKKESPMSGSPLAKNVDFVDSSIQVTGSELEKELIDPEYMPEDDAIRENEEQIKGITETMKEFGVSDEALSEIATQYYKDAADALNITGTTELDQMFEESESGSDISLNAAMKIFMNQHPEVKNPLKSIWPLISTGVPIVCTAFSGQEMSQFLDDANTGLFDGDRPKETPDLEKLRSIFTILYRHYVNPSNLSFTQWLKGISASDFNSLIFSQYNAQFSHNNFISYQCTKKGCSKLYLEKKNIMDMVVFNNDEAKERFNKILHKEAVPSGLYRTPPIPINDTFAISFTVPSIYSMQFERNSLSEADKKKYSSIVSMLPAIDSVYILDHRNRKRQRINFGVVAKSLEQTTMRKINGLVRIMLNFNLDQRSKMLSEYVKVLKNVYNDYMSYQIPASKCPSCGTEVEAYPIDPLGALFLRARLSTDVASTRAWL